MALKTNLRIAFVHLTSKKRQTIVAIMGVMFGIAMFILMSGLMTGVNNILDNTLFTTMPHVRLFNQPDNKRPAVIDYLKNDSTAHAIYHQHPKAGDAKIDNAFSIISYLKKNPSVVCISEHASSPVFYLNGASQISGQLMGVNLLNEDAMFGLRKKLRGGSLENVMQIKNSVLMGDGLADLLNVKLGDLVTLSSPTGRLLTLKVAGFFHFGVAAVDNIRCYTNLAVAQTLLDKDASYISEIYVNINDINEADHFAARMKQNFHCSSEGWQTANATMLAGSKLRIIMTFIVSITMLIVAGFGIYNILSMTINDKMKDIAILKATGFAGGDIVRIFMFQSLIIGISGALLGLLLGYTLSVAVSKVPFDAKSFFDLDHLPMNFNPVFYLIGVWFGIITTAIAGYMPSRRASKIDPVVILRG